MDLEQSAFEALRFASAQSLKLYKQPLVITYSGGKDSDVLLRLAENSGIPFELLHSITTADAPETVYHVRDTFLRMEEKGVKCVIDAHVQPDGKRVTMWNLIPKKMMPPTRLMRYCCAELKEGGGKGRFIVTGVRWAESVKRKNNRGLIEVSPSDKNKRLIGSIAPTAARGWMEGPKVNESAADWGLVFDTLLLIAFLQSDAETPEAAAEKFAKKLLDIPENVDLFAETPEERRARSDKWYAQEWEKLEIDRNDG